MAVSEFFLLFRRVLEETIRRIGDYCMHRVLGVCAQPLETICVIEASISDGERRVVPEFASRIDRVDERDVF
jgi:hypothetical protein